MCSSAAGRWPCRTFSAPSGVVGTKVASSSFSASSDAVISSTPEPTTSRRRQPVSGDTSGAPAVECRRDQGLRPLGGEAGEQRMEEQGGDVGDRVAPGRVVQRRRDGVDARGDTLGVGGDEHGLGGGLGGGERRGGAGLVRERDHEPAVGRGEAGLEGVADVEPCVGERLACDRARRPGGVLAGAAAGEQDLLGVGDPRWPAAPVRRCPRSGRAGRPRRGSSPPSPTGDRCGVRARRSCAHLGWYPCS